MKFEPIRIKDKLGLEIELRSADASDADSLISYLKTTATETPYLVREPEEVTLTTAREQDYIRSIACSENELMLIASENGKLMGSCSLMSAGRYFRYRHRCQVAIALYKEYWGRGVGEIMMETVLDAAKSVGYEQAELEVIAGNEKAIALYEKLGFERVGALPDNMKYKDGSYADSYWMMKKL